ncbi:MAG: hypothetical protein K2I29_02660 [Clostridia bacterium]|nr:hypothetical protein [Clostridia bacterium]
MEAPTTEQEHTEKDVAIAFLSIHANVLINSYITENVIFGRIKPHDDVPVKQYLEKLGFCNLDSILNDLFLNGDNIQKGYVTERDFNRRCFELYKIKTESLFTEIPFDKSYGDWDDIYHYKYGWYEYLKNLYTLFEEIIKTEVSPDLFTAVPDIPDNEEIRNYYLAASKFVLAIKTKGLRQGRRIDRYLKKINFVSPFIQRLIKKHKGRFYLKNSDTNSLDYKLALLSCLRFYNEDNAKLFELKMLRWEEQRYKAQ